MDAKKKSEYKMRAVAVIIGILILAGMIIWLKFMKENFVQDAMYMGVYGLALGWVAAIYTMKCGDSDYARKFREAKTK